MTRAPRRPRSPRRLIATGLALLAGTGGAQTQASVADAPSQPAATAQVKLQGRRLVAAAALAQTAEWQRIAAAWAEAVATADRKRGDYPFDEPGKKRVLDALTTAGAEVVRLRKAGWLDAPEEELLRTALARLAAEVAKFRTSEARGATCYKPVPPPPPRAAIERLAARVPLLEKVAARGQLQPDVVERILRSVDQDLEEAREALGDLQGAQAASARRTVGRAEAAVARLRGQKR
jgi:hypothetical protein